MITATSHFDDSLIRQGHFDEFDIVLSDLLQFAIIDIEGSVYCRVGSLLLKCESLIVKGDLLLSHSHSFNTRLRMLFDCDHFLQSIHFTVHTPDVDSIGCSSDSESFSDFYSLQGRVSFEAILDDLKVVEQPTVLWIAVLKIDEGFEIDNHVEQTTLLPEFGEIACIQDLQTVVERVVVEKFANTHVLNLQFVMVLSEIHIEYLTCGIFVEVVLAVGSLNDNSGVSQFAILVSVDPASADALQSSDGRRQSTEDQCLLVRSEVLVDSAQRALAELVVGVDVGSDDLLSAADLRQEGQQVFLYFVLAIQYDLHPAALQDELLREVHHCVLLDAPPHHQSTQEVHYLLDRLGYLQSTQSTDLLLHVALQSYQVLLSASLAQLLQLAFESALYEYKPTHGISMSAIGQGTFEIANDAGTGLAPVGYFASQFEQSPALLQSRTFTVEIGEVLVVLASESRVDIVLEEDHVFAEQHFFHFKSG